MVEQWLCLIKSELKKSSLVVFPFSTTPAEDQLWFPFSTRPNQLSNKNRRRSSGAQDGVGRVLQRPALLICELVPLSEAIGSRQQDK